MPPEPESLVLRLLREMRAEMSDMRAEMSDMRAELKAEIASVRDEFKSNLHSLRADVAADLIHTRKELNEQIVGLRRAVIDYHTSVIGHGALISDLESRAHRLEQHLGLPLPDAHRQGSESTCIGSPRGSR